MDEYREALEDLKEKQILYGLANEEYEPIAYHNLKSAEERVNAIIRTSKERVG